MKNFDFILNEPIPEKDLNQIGLLISKNGMRVCEPENTRLICISNFWLRIRDRIAMNLLTPQLTNQIGKYQQGFRPGCSTFNHIEEILDNLHLNQRSRKPGGCVWKLKAEATNEDTHWFNFFSKDWKDCFTVVRWDLHLGVYNRCYMINVSMQEGDMALYTIATATILFD